MKIGYEAAKEIQYRYTRRIRHGHSAQRTHAWCVVCHTATVSYSFGV